MAITSTDNQTAAAPIVEAAVANKTDPPPADETSEPAPAETSKPVSCPLSANAAACKHSVVDPHAHAPRYLSMVPLRSRVPPHRLTPQGLGHSTG